MKLFFEQVELHNFGSHKDTSFNIVPGRHLICGQNGKGKSTLFEGLVACLFKNARSKDPSFNHEGNCEAKVRLTIDGEKQVQIKRYWGMKDKIKSPQIFVNEEELGFRRSTESEKELKNILGISYDLFIMTVVVLQGLPMNFCSLGPTVRKTIIEDLFGFNAWDGIRKKFGDTLKQDSGKGVELRGEFEHKKENMIQLNTRIQTLKDVGNESEERYGNEIVAIKEKVREVMGRIEAYKSESANTPYLEEGKEVQYRDQVEVLNNSARMIETRKNELRSVVDTGQCYACHRDFPEAMVQSAIEEMNMLEQKSGKTKAVIEHTNVELQKVTQIQNQLNAMNAELQQLTYQLQAKAEARPQPNQQVDFSQMENELGEIQAIVNSLNEDIKALQTDIEKLQYVDGLLKPSSEFRTQVLKDRVGYINRLMSSITPFLFKEVSCQLLLDGSGIEIDITKEGQKVDYKELSGGERRRIDLIHIFSFQRFIQDASGVSSNLLVFDEIFENLDAEGVESVLTCVESLFPEASSIYVITHRDNIKSQFNSLVRVTKDNGVSRIEVC